MKNLVNSKSSNGNYFVTLQRIFEYAKNEKDE